MEKFLIIDGNSIMNRAFYGIPYRAMSIPGGLYTNALYGFLNTYIMIKNMVNPDYVAVSFDLREKTFRHDMYEEYKGTRKGMPEELKPQMPIIKEILKAMNIEVLELEKYEADDILGTTAKINSENNIFTYILTGDRDSYQLISDKASVVMPHTKQGKTEYTIYTPELLKETLGIEPYQIIDVKSLMGDSSDNIPGVKGIGEKTAYSLIQKYTTLDNIYSNIDNLEVSDKIKEKLKSDEDMARLSYKLATIFTDVPIKIDYENCKLKEINKEELYKIFKKLDFLKLAQRFGLGDISTPEIDVPEECLEDDFLAKCARKRKKILEEKTFVYIDKNNKEDILNAAASLKENDTITYILNITTEDYFTRALNIDREFLGMYINDKIYIIKLEEEAFKLEILRWFATLNVTKIGYNIKQDIRYLFDNDIYDVRGFDFDLMVAYYLIDSGRGKYPFDFLLSVLFAEKLKNDQSGLQVTMFDEIDNEKSTSYFKDEDIYNISVYLLAVYESRDIIIDKLKEIKCYELFQNIEMKLTETLASMEHTGMYIDKQKLDEFDRELSSRIAKLVESIYKLAGEEFNINSTKQLGDILFKKLGLPVIRKNKSGYSTDKEVLEELEDKHEIIPALLEYRQYSKLKSTYVDGLRDKIKPNGRVHTTFMQTVASTGRLSSIEPNLQNIPIRLELGSKIRTFFVGEGGRMLLDSDYSQIELRVLAHMSEDKLMIEAFNNGVDVHSATASQVFNINIEDVTPDMRRKAKAVNFGIVYGISEFGLSKNINSSRNEAKEYMENYLNKYVGIQNFMKDIVSIAKEQGYVSTLYGRRRYIDEISSKNKNIERFGERVAMNAPVQGTAADIIKVAMNNVYNDIKKNNLKSRLIMQVHDELIVEIENGEEEQIKAIVKNAMENVLKLKVQLKIDMNVGKSWYDAK